MVRSSIVAFGITLAAIAPASAEAPGPASSKRGRDVDTIQGVVRFEGAPPERKPQPRASDPYCAKTAALSDEVVVTDGKLKDAVVRITAGPRSATPAPTGPALIDQKDCSYAPRVLGIAAGQQLQARNSDGTFHNVHGTRAGQQLWNQPAVPGSKDLVLDTADAKTGARPGDVIEVTCDVHPWMRAYAVVVDGPFAVTSETGNFALAGLKPGKYTLEAWHPTLGTATAKVTLGAKGPARTELVFRAKKS